MEQPQPNQTITQIPGILVGHYTDQISLTGCTVLRFSQGSATVAISVQGSAPGTRETDSLEPINMVDKIHAIVLTGGSSFGLEAASGVMNWLEEQGIGKDVGDGMVIPIVTSSVLFDLDIGNPKIRPTSSNGIFACQQATSLPVISGNIGAGTGATVGKILGMEKAMKSGLGSGFMELAGGVKIGALIAVNSIGNILDEQGKVIAGIRAEKKGEFESAVLQILSQNPSKIFKGKNTTIGIVAINVPMNKIQLQKVAQMAHDGLARSINPVHTMYDGDAIFAVSVPEEKFLNINADNDTINLAGVAAAEVTSMAIRNAVYSATSIEGYPAHLDWCK